jgi:hypothetical protein
MSATDSCLVLCVEERDDKKYENVLLTIFVTYDFESGTFVIYGKRKDHFSKVEGTFTTNFEPFFFRTDTVRDAYMFIRFVVGKESLCSYTLYNYNNMPIMCDTVDYYFMENNMALNYEIVAYDNVIIKERELSNIIQLLRKTFNFC